MMIDRPSPDILIFDPPPQSLRHFRAVYRLALALSLIYFGAAFIFLLLTSVLLFYALLRHQISGVDKPDVVIIASFGGIFISVFNSFVLYILCKLDKPVLVQSCSFDRQAGELSIQQYNLVDRHQKTITIPLNTIVDIQVRHSYLAISNFFAISLMTNQSSKPIYLFQNVSQNKISTFTMKSLLEEVAIIQRFLNLPIEPPYMMVKPFKWYEKLVNLTFAEFIESINETNSTLTCSVQYPQIWETKTWKFDRNAANIEIESRDWISKSSRYIMRSEIGAIAIKTEFLPLEFEIHNLARSTHKRQYQKQYSAILIPSVLGASACVKGKKNRSRLKPQQGYWRIFTSTDLSLVRDLVDRVQAHLDLPLDELLSTESIESEPVGAIK